ncbi:CHASE domain-containing protein [Marinobacterium stanieri]|uniref:CHASE domain-containing protein n=1 Tax=Marinobacterium stanieri TaxID=49186 RepID=UPI000255A34F|nr:PAS domain S-box protein [Marinobacterium stanieri]
MVQFSRTQPNQLDPKDSPPFWSSPALILILFVLGLALSLLVSHQSAQSTRDAVDGRFNSRADQVTHLLQERVAHFSLLLQSARGTLLNTADLEPRHQSEHWHRMFDSFDLDFASLGIVGLSYTAYVPAGQQAIFAARHQIDEQTLDIFPPPSIARPSFVVLYLSPGSIERRMRGYDIASGPSRYNAALEARQSGVVSVTPPLSLLPTDVSSLDYLLLLPVTHQKPGKSEEFLGWTTLGFSMSKIIAQSLQPQNGQMQIRLYDPRQPDLEPTFDSHPDQTELNGPSGTRYIQLGSERIRLDFHSLDTRINSLFDRQFDMNTLVAGLAVTLFLALTLMSFIIARTRTDRLNHKLSAQAAEVHDRYRILFEQCPEAVVVHINGQVELANTHAAQLFGYESPEGLYSRHVRELVHPDSMDIVKQRSSSRQPGEPLPPSEQTLVRQDGSTFEAEVTSSLIHLNGENAVQVLFRDISAEKQTRREAGIAKTLILQNHDAIMVTDAAGTIEMVNPAFEAMTGYTRQQIIGENPAIMNSGQHGKPFFFELWRSLKQHGHWQGHIINRKQGGELFVQSTEISAVRDEQRKTTHFVCLLQDVTKGTASENQQQLMTLQNQRKPA